MFLVIQKFATEAPIPEIAFPTQHVARINQNIVILTIHILVILMSGILKHFINLSLLFHLLSKTYSLK
jgi:hypothetical protein